MVMMTDDEVRSQDASRYQNKSVSALLRSDGASIDIGGRDECQGRTSNKDLATVGTRQ